MRNSDYFPTFLSLNSKRYFLSEVEKARATFPQDEKAVKAEIAASPGGYDAVTLASI